MGIDSRTLSTGNSSGGRYLRASFHAEGEGERGRQVTCWLEYGSTLPLIKVKAKYEIRYADDIGTASTEGYVDLIFVNGDSYYFYEIPTLFTKEE